MTDQSSQPITERVKVGAEPLTDAEIRDLKKEIGSYRQGVGEMLARLNEQGFTVDAGVEAVIHLRWFLTEIGLLTPDQALALEASWEATFFAQLRTLARSAAAAANRPIIVTPPNSGRGLIIPKGNRK